MLCYSNIHVLTFHVFTFDGRIVAMGAGGIPWWSRSHVGLLAAIYCVCACVRVCVFTSSAYHW